MRRSVKVGLPTVLAAALLLGCQSGAGGETAQPSRSASSTASSTGSTSGSSTGSSATTAAEDSTPADPSSTPRSGRVGLFFGDSNFVGGGCTPDADEDMAAIAADRLGYQAAIRGEGGTGFDSGNPQYDLPDYLGQIKQGALDVSPAPQLVVIEGGSNDTGRPLDVVRRHAARVLQTAQSEYPQALVVLMGPIDVRAGRGDVGPGIVGALRKAAAQRDAPFLDAYDWLPWRTQGGLVCSDYDHLTPAGQRIVGRTLAAALESVGA